MKDNLCETCEHWHEGTLDTPHLCWCDVDEIGPDSYKSTKVVCYAYRKLKERESITDNVEANGFRRPSGGATGSTPAPLAMG